MKKNIMLLLLVAVGVSSCLPNLQANGFFKPEGEAETLVAKKVDLDEHKSLLVVPPAFWKPFMKRINYFDEVLDRNEFELQMQAHNEAYKNLKLSSTTAKSVHEGFRPFLYMKVTYNYTLNNAPTTYLELIDPETAEPIFRTRSKEFNTAALNKLIEYIRANSTTYSNL